MTGVPRTFKFEKVMKSITGVIYEKLSNFGFLGAELNSRHQRVKLLNKLRKMATLQK